MSSRGRSPICTARSGRSFLRNAATRTMRSDIQAAYPIHPEMFDRLYTDWSTLVKFQRTRGVLRLMAAVIHCLWEKGDRNPLILPSTIPIDDPRVQFELTRYLSDNWVPVIEKDVDGPNSLPLRIDGEVPNLGKLHACRRVARTIYLGSAPTAAAAHRGIEDRRVETRLCDAGRVARRVRRCAAAARRQQRPICIRTDRATGTPRQPTVTKLAEDRAEQLKRDPDKVAQELEDGFERTCARLVNSPRIILAASGADVPDDRMPGWSCCRRSKLTARRPAAPPRLAAKAILESRGNTPRLYPQHAGVSRGRQGAASRIWTKRCASTWPGSRSSRRRRPSISTPSRHGRLKTRNRPPTAR